MFGKKTKNSEIFFSPFGKIIISGMITITIYVFYTKKNNNINTKTKWKFELLINYEEEQTRRMPS